MTNNRPVTGRAAGVTQKSLRISLCVAAIALLFSLYTWGISKNPRGFYLDESATAYNAYLVSRTGAGEFGPRFPVLFQQFTVSNATYMNPLAISHSSRCEGDADLARVASGKKIAAPAISASSKASSPVPQLVQGYARRDCGHAPQTGVFWTLLLSRAAAVGLFAQCLIDKPD